MTDSTLELDCVIFGGGAAGLFTLDRLRASGHSVLLLERTALGAGQTRCAQGIIHGGTKYSLAGLIGADSRAIAAMPERWLRMAEGAETPSLAAAHLRSRHCWLWRSDGLAGRIGMLGAKLALRVRPEEVARDDRPAILRDRSGAVLKLAEPVFDSSSVLEAIAAQHRDCIALAPEQSLEVHASDDDIRLRVAIDCTAHDTPILFRLHARCAILAAGIGNEMLRADFSRPGGRTQRRPLHQVLVRSPSLPWLDGHCVDGDATRVTITSAHDDEGRVVWHVGGRLAEEGVVLDHAAQIRRAISELRAVLPGAAIDDAEWSAYRVDRAEPLTDGRRPDDAQLIEEGPVLSLWPTKLALAPRAAELAAVAVRQRLARNAGAGVSRGSRTVNPDAAAASPWGFELRAPAAAPPPWHDAHEWTREP